MREIKCKCWPFWTVNIRGKNPVDQATLFFGCCLQFSLECSYIRIWPRANVPSWGDFAIKKQYCFSLLYRQAGNAYLAWFLLSEIKISTSEFMQSSAMTKQSSIQADTDLKY
jgi:hypothetical protein